MQQSWFLLVQRHAVACCACVVHAFAFVLLLTLVMVQRTLHHLRVVICCCCTCVCSRRWVCVVWSGLAQLTESTCPCNLCLSQALSVAYVYYCALYHSSLRETCTPVSCS